MPPAQTFAMLSNQELADKLREYGVTVGPIVGTTRGLYEKKLQRLVSGQVSLPRYEEVPDDEEEEEEETVVHDHVSFSRPTAGETRRRGHTQVTPSRPTRQRQPEFFENTCSQSQRTAHPPNKKGGGKKGFSVWPVLFILLILAGLGYLIVKNMETEAENSIPSQIDAQV